LSAEEKIILAYFATKGDAFHMEFLEAGQVPKIHAKEEFIRRYLSEKVYRQMRLCLFQAGEYLYTEGETTGYLFIMLDGSCKVFKTLENGKTVLLCRYEEAQVLGEFELFGDPVAKTNVQALKNTYCLAVSVCEHRSLLLSDNQFLQFVCYQTCCKIERNNTNTATNLLYPLEQRLAGYILTMQNNGSFSANYTMLAEYLGCSLRHLLRTFRTLCDKQILQKTNAVYLLQDAHSLEILAGNIYRQ
jgi:CRP/FNR family putative post-exponential-phase nitrogen-starvation transcriptional regulator